MDKLNLAVSKIPYYHGILLPDYPEFANDVEKKMLDIKNFDSRESDILLCSSMKSGSHWLLEIISMLISGSCDVTKETVLSSNLEYTRLEAFEDRPNPRIIHSHLPLKFLPAKHLEKAYKTVLVMRNPKDRLASYYFSILGKMPGLENLKWSDYFNRIIQEGVPRVYGDWFDYTLEWATELKKNSTNIFPIFYEDLKENFAVNVKRLGEFLCVERDASFYSEIEHKCSFEYMKKNKADDLVAIDHKGRSTLYRKGEIGDWKNLFTVAQNEQFDELLQRKMSGSIIHFKFE
ncbi:sulfotransferase 1E1-like [Mytilus galloprovincialis]|uniref:sulfotransferase 1E1-like n=1 Tax=Mytilus galloprovincialis TaxID=29158 RepID=UPI003F7CD173